MKRFSCLFKFFIVVGILLPQRAGAQSESLLILFSPTAQPILAGSESSVALLFLNPSPSSVKFTAPLEMPAKLTWGGQTVSTVLRQVAEQSAELEIVAGGFREIRYAIMVPRSANGRVLLELSQPGGATTSLIVDGPRSNEVAGTTLPASQPASQEIGLTSSDSSGPANARSASQPSTPSGLVEYVASNFTAHEPIYFLYGNEDPSAKFQVSFKYRLFNSDGPLARKVPAISGVHLAYTQRSFWDLEADSAPFFDSSYKPELLFVYEDPKPGRWPIVSRIDFQAGVLHESNGRSGEDSRSLNNAYLRPVVTFGDKESVFLTISPRFVAYLGSLYENPDLKDYRGYGDIRVVVGEGDGLQLAATGRIGDDWDKGSLELDLTYPLRRLLFGNLDLYLHAQYFTGYGESLLLYNKNDSTFRLGISLVR